jgi:hypothetical protein
VGKQNTHTHPTGEKKMTDKETAKEIREAFKVLNVKNESTGKPPSVTAK